MWSATTQLALVAIIVAVATTVALLLRSRRLLHRRFAAFAISVAVYYLTAFIRGLIPSTDTPPTLVGLRIAAGGAILVSATIFFDAILGEAGVVAKTRRQLTVILGAALVLLGVAAAASLIDGSVRLIAQGAAAGGVLTVLGLRAARVLQKTALVKSESDRIRLRYLAAGGLLALLGFGLDIAAFQGIEVPPLGGLIVALYLYFISQALMVSRLLDLHELLGRALVFGVLAIILAGVYGVLVYWADESGGLFLFNTFMASGIILILFEPLKTYLDETASRVFFRERATFTHGMRATAIRLQNLIEPQPAVSEVLDAVYEQKGATCVSIYLLDEAGLALLRQGYRGAIPARGLDAKAHATFFNRVFSSGEPVLRDRVRRRQGVPDPFDAPPETTDVPADAGPVDATPELNGRNNAERQSAMLATLDLLLSDLVIPIRSGDHTLGVFCLRDDRLSEAYASDEIRALTAVADRLALIVENSRLFDRIKERDRLASIGEMSAGLAHEVRNPLAAIKGAAQLLDPRSLDGEDGELLGVIIEEVDRLNTVVSGFLDYARPHRGTFIPMAVNDAVAKTVALMSHDIPEHISVTLDLQNDLPDVSGDAELLQQVLINLLLNARDALTEQAEARPGATQTDAAEPSGPIALPAPHVTVSTASTPAGPGPSPGEVLIRVHDNGPGIPENIRKNLFIPFFTTKRSGTGLGLAMCERIVQSHDGSIEVTTAKGAGTTFTLRLPAQPIRVNVPQPPTDPHTDSSVDARSITPPDIDPPTKVLA